MGKRGGESGWFPASGDPDLMFTGNGYQRSGIHGSVDDCIQWIRMVMIESSGSIEIRMRGIEF